MNWILRFAGLIIAVLIIGCSSGDEPGAGEALRAVALRVQEMTKNGTALAMGERRPLEVLRQVGYPDRAPMDSGAIAALEAAGIRTVPPEQRTDSSAQLWFWRVSADSSRSDLYRVVGSLLYRRPGGAFSNEAEWLVDCGKRPCKIVHEEHTSHSDYGR